MGKYVNHEDFGAKAPVSYREDTTSESYLKGMSSISPPGMKPKVSRGQKFEQKTDFKASALWHRNYDQAMFAGSDIGSPDFLNLQRILEKRGNNPT
jgi:hypothetical protein